MLPTFLLQKSQIKENLNLNLIRKPYSFFVIDTTLASVNPLRFRKILIKCNKNHGN